MEYERPAIEERVQVGGPVIEGGTIGSGSVIGTPVWKRDDAGPAGGN